MSITTVLALLAPLQLPITATAYADTVPLHLHTIEQGYSAQLWNSEIKAYQSRAEANAKKYGLTKTPTLLFQSATITDGGITYFISVFDNECVSAGLAPKGTDQADYPEPDRCPVKIAVLTNNVLRVIATSSACLQTNYDPSTEKFVEPRIPNTISITKKIAQFHAYSCPEGENKKLSLTN